MLGDYIPASPPAYSAFYSNSFEGQGHHGGSAILVRRDIPCTSLELDTPLQAVAVKVFMDRPYTVCSLYLPPSVTVERGDLNHLVRDLPSPFILLGDFNGRHPLWGDSSVNPRGVLLASFIEDEGLGVLNTGDVTHFNSPTGTFTAIDISLCSPSALLDFTWRVLPDLYGSDHFPILLEGNRYEPQSRLPRWKLEKADWQFFRELTSSVSSVADFGSSDEAVTYFTDTLHSAALNSIPRTSGYFPKRPVPWWSPVCTTAVREKRAAFSRLRRNRGDPTLLEDFRRARARARRVLKEARRASWKAYVSSINTKTPLTQVFRRVCKMAGKFSPSSPPVLKVNGIKIMDGLTVANTMAEAFAKVSSRDSRPLAVRHELRVKERTVLDFSGNENESYNHIFTLRDLHSALSLSAATLLLGQTTSHMQCYDTWQLHLYGLRGRLPRFLKEFLSGRSFSVRVGTTHSASVAQEEGVPQGSVLSVTLFAVAINAIASPLPDGIANSMYVDDLTVWFAASRMSVAERRMQLALDRVSRWTDSHGFRFSPSKTIAMHFYRIRGIHLDLDLFMYGHRIRCVEETRFLGLLFDKRLTWVPHLRTLKVSCLKALNLLRVLSHTSWGADRATLLRLYHIVIRSKLDYGCEVYSSATDARLRVLDPVHHAGVRLATGAFRSSQIPSLLVDANEPPLDLRRQSLMVRCWHRLHRLPDTLPCLAVSSDIMSQYYLLHSRAPRPFGFRVRKAMEEMGIDDYQICPVRVPRVAPWLLPEVFPCTCFTDKKEFLPPPVARSLFLEHAFTHRESLPVYTDGSKSDAGVGFGVVFPDFCRGGRFLSVSAILYALQVIFTLPQPSFTIFSDSCSALQALCNFNSTHPLVLAILEWLVLLGRRGRKVTFCWVPAHVGVDGNERADALAKAVVSNSRPPARCHPVPAVDLRPYINATVRSCWQDRWDAIGANKLRDIRQRLGLWSYSGLSRRWYTALVRLRIGHTLLTHGFLMERLTLPTVMIVWSL
ncbi:hypothetical protein Pcinc_001312 [Petrolisthes cinctipes]|uniref:RNA-directed DNA polymerase from mobile element jockey n=1 Tax=Petrolisthes cinctipes TaxID=88211 RepID=A0AAE1GN82_PETCI|nr:hypothetical protein Pcinc_001312 [Petrolisthes cinctipes]